MLKVVMYSSENIHSNALRGLWETPGQMQVGDAGADLE